MVYDTTFSGGQAPTKSVIPQWPYSSVPDCKASGEWENLIKVRYAARKIGVDQSGDAADRSDPRTELR